MHLRQEDLAQKDMIILVPIVRKIIDWRVGLTSIENITLLWNLCILLSPYSTSLYRGLLNEPSYLTVRDTIFMSFSTGGTKGNKKFPVPPLDKSWKLCPLLSDVLYGSFESPWHNKVEYGLRC